MLFKFINREIAFRIVLKLINSEIMFLEAGASKCVNGIGTGGLLSLSETGINFSSSQDQVTIIGWNQINKVICYKTLGVIPNGFTLVLVNEDLHHFVVDSRSDWHEAIEQKLKEIKRLQYQRNLR